MVHIFSFFEFRTLLTWIFETTSWIISVEILDFHAYVGRVFCRAITSAEPPSSFFRKLLSSWLVVAIYKTPQSQREHGGSTLAQFQLRHSKSGQLILMRNGIQNAYSINAVELRAHRGLLQELERWCVCSLTLRNIDSEQNASLARL